MKRTISTLFYLTMIGMLLLTGCTFPIDPNILSTQELSNSQELFVVPPIEISAEMPYETKFVEVLGSHMAYVEAGKGDPILFLHGNPTSKYLWRNVMPWLAGQGRVIALDLIGMGESAKPDIGYTFAEQSTYVDGFIAALELQQITLVVHDWGSALGFDYARRNPENVKAIAFMEALITPAMPASLATMPPNLAAFFPPLRTEGVGEEMILEQNIFVEQVLPASVMRGLTEAEMIHYRAPYADPASRLPTLVWPRQIPIDGEPADVVARVNAYNAWLMSSDLPKLHLYVAPGAINPPEAVAFLQQTLSNYEAIYLGQGLHFVQEDHPEAIGRNIADWYRRVNR
jgi:haloalkane dehalogenase